jgi:hypothetical protein
MSFADREQIFSKDYLDIEDLQNLLGLTYQLAARKMREIKFKFDRLGIQGKIHTEDYFEYFNITDKQRYVKEQK